MGTVCAVCAVWGILRTNIKAPSSTAGSISKSPETRSVKSLVSALTSPRAGAAMVFIVTLTIVAGHLGSVVDIRLGNLTGGNWSRLIEEPLELAKFLSLLGLFPFLTYSLLTVWVGFRSSRKRQP